MARVLRVALIHGSRIIEDRTFAAGARVTIGRAPRSTFLAPTDDFPLCFTLFDGRTLRWPEGATGRLALSAVAERELTDFKPSGVDLPETARGRLTIGSLSLVFHFVEPAAAPPRAALPREFRGRLLGQLDRAFLGVLAASLLAHFAGAGWLVSQPLPPDDEVRMENEDRAPDRFARAHLPPPAAPHEATPSQPPASPAKPKAGPSAAAAASPGTAPRALMGLLAVIGARGDGHSGLDDVLGASSSVGDVARALDGASTVRVATASDDRLHGPEAGEARTIGPLVTAPVHTVTLAEVAGPPIHGRAQPQELALDQRGALDSAKLATWMKSRTPAIQSCYERELKRNQTLHGRLVLRFSITPRGRTSNVDIQENTLGSAEVGGCIQNLVKGWVLPFTPEDEVAVSFPWVFVPAT